SSKPIRLIVIDPHDTDRMHLKQILQSSGLDHELTEFKDAKGLGDLEALNSANCIFIDYVLPDDDGLLVLKRMRDMGVKTPIVIISSQGNETIAVELMKAGASDYILKTDIDVPSMTQVLRNIMKVSHVVKEREKTEHALRISESRLAEAQRIAKFGNWDVDILAQTVYCSPEVFNILESPEKQDSITIKDVFHIIHPEDRQLVDEAWQNALHGKPFNFDFRLATKSGVKFVNSQGYTQRNANGYPQKIIGTLQDITERKTAEQEILRARELAENSMKVREIFLANMSHEIRTPMNAILGFTRLLYETPLTLEQKGFVDAIHFSGENLLVIINDILDLSKIQSGKMSLEKCEFNLHDLTSGVIKLLSPKAKEKNLRLASRIEQQIPAVIKGDPVRLNQVLTNLLANAIKFTEQGSVTLDINSAASQNENLILEFSVSDTGIGIPDDKQAVIFEDFVQASADTTRRYGGTGLGLAITKKLVALQEGTITVESKIGTGSTFIVRVPFEQVDQKKHTDVTRVGQRRIEVVERLKTASVLVVEDNAVNQLLVKKVLEKAGCQVQIAANGLAAISCLKSAKFDVVLMDIQMPEMDGYETTQFIRKNFSAPLNDIPIIAMTAHAFGSDVMRCINEGMNDYISKPFKTEDLYHKILKVLSTNERPKVISLHGTPVKEHIDMRDFYDIGNGDQQFLQDLMRVFDEHTPGFVDKLRACTQQKNFPAMRTLCNQIRSSYGRMHLAELQKAIDEMMGMLNDRDPHTHYTRIMKITDEIIHLISAINNELKTIVRKAC
ncbi:MAG TPA: response regulator, partial [Chryseosolibacter sp.]|nr:response regulator [Chryseosolibacter sp.]